MKPLDTLAQSLIPEHLLTPEPTEALLAEVEKATDSPKPPTDPAKPDPRDSEVWTFNFNYKARNGKVFQGQFTNTILGLGERQKAAILVSRMLGNAPVEAIDPAIYNITTAVAHMELSLGKAANRPEWARDLRAIKDMQVIAALWKEVDGHETHHFRPGEASEEG